MRLFFALWPPKETALALERWAQPLKGRCTPAGKIHLTLAFLGEADAAKACTAARRVQAGAFRLPIDDARHWARNEIVWAGPQRVPEELKRLAEGLHLELFKESFILERRPLAAHVTLLRKAPSQVLPALPRLEWPVREFDLVSSSLEQGRAAYRTVERFALA
jgi:2'-5' RNA ligase